jgi:hypothetical protein
LLEDKTLLIGGSYMAAWKCAHISKIIYIGMDVECPPKLSKIQKITKKKFNNKK